MVYQAILSTVGGGILIIYGLFMFLLIFAPVISYPYEAINLIPALSDILPPVFIGLCGLAELLVSFGFLFDAAHARRYGVLLTISFGVSLYSLIRLFPLPFQNIGLFAALVYPLASAQILVLSGAVWAIFSKPNNQK